MKRLLFLFGPLLLLFLLPSPGSAQFCPPRSEHPELWTKVQDYLWVCRIVGTGDTVAPEEIAAAYDFEIIYYAINRISYTFTECRRNDQPLVLKEWKEGRKAAVEGLESGTEPFTVTDGDTLSFFRYILWREGIRFPDVYLALDTLDYVVELVRISDSSRAVLVDSIGLLPLRQLGTPVVYGHRPLMAIVNYRVPPELDGQSVFLRVLVHRRGEREEEMVRMDHTTIKNSSWLADSSFQKYLSTYSPIRPQRNLGDYEQVDSDGDMDLTVASKVSGGEEIAISFITSSDPGQTTIGVYDMLGRARFFPYMGRDSGERITIRHVFPESGTYLVVLLHDGHIVESRRVQVLR